MSATATMATVAVQVFTLPARALTIREKNRKKTQLTKAIVHRLNRPDSAEEIIPSLNMPSREELSYFGAGPAGLPTKVLETAAQALVNFNNTGLGLAEHSHRSELASKVLNDAKKSLADFLQIPDDYEILFMQGGGSGQFSATVSNLVGVWVQKRKEELVRSLGVDESDANVINELRKVVEGQLKVDYLVTGSWSLKASQEAARLLGPEYVNIVTDSRKANDGKFGKIPEESTWSLSKAPAFVYYCDNETVDGVEFPGFPSTLEDKIVVADMSSNILSRKIPVNKFSVIFFGAQKNLGCAGITGVIIKKSLLPPVIPTVSATILRKLALPIQPVVFDYATIAKNNSLYNTLPIFDVYIGGQVLEGLLVNPGSIEKQEEIATKKAQLIYSTLEAHPETYHIVPDKSVRSRMNICFRIIKGSDHAAAEKAFLAGGTKRGLTGLKGHRSVGGIRASNYNSIKPEAAEKLVEYLKDFAAAEDVQSLA